MKKLENKYKVSIIIPVYGVEKYVEKCARSLFEQTFEDIEYIFVNDCTKDKSIEILEKVIVDYPNRKDDIIILHNKQNKKLAATRDVGLRMAKGEYVLNCDSDDWVELNMVEVMYNKAKESGADIVCCEIFKECVCGQELFKYEYSEEKGGDKLLKLYLYDQYTAIWNKLIKRDLFFKFDIWHYDGVNMGEDSAVTIRLRYFSEKTEVVHTPLYHYNRQNENSMCVVYNENATKEYMRLALLIEDFFRQEGVGDKYQVVVNYLKFVSKQNILRQQKDLKLWKSIYPECHKDIFRFTYFSFIGRCKWWMCAYLPTFLVEKFIR